MCYRTRVRTQYPLPLWVKVAAPPGEPLCYPRGWLKTFTNAAGKTVTYRYSALGQLSRMTTPGGLNFDYTYSELGLLGTVTNPDSVSTSFAYDNALRPSCITRPGSYIDFTYNNRDWITDVHNRKTDGTVRYDADYAYNDGALWDHTGNPLKRTEDLAGST